MSDLEKYFQKFEAPKQQLALQLRELVKAASPALQENIKWGQPTYSCQGNVCYISVNTNHINLGFYRGSELTSDLLKIEGTGKNLRHIKIKDQSQLQTEAIIRLVQKAVQLEENI